MVKPKQQAVYVLNTFTSGCAGIPHIGTKGWLCKNKSHNHAAQQIGKVCVVFRACYDPSDGSPKVPKGYLPVHLFFPPDFLSKRKIGVKRTAELRLAFNASRDEGRAKLEQEAKKAQESLKKSFPSMELIETLWEKYKR